MIGPNRYNSCIFRIFTYRSSNRPGKIRSRARGVRGSQATMPLSIVHGASLRQFFKWKYKKRAVHILGYYLTCCFPMHTIELRRFELILHEGGEGRACRLSQAGWARAHAHALWDCHQGHSCAVRAGALFSLRLAAGWAPRRSLSVPLLLCLLPLGKQAPRQSSCSTCDAWPQRQGFQPLSNPTSTTCSTPPFAPHRQQCAPCSRLLRHDEHT